MPQLPPLPQLPTLPEPHRRRLRRAQGELRQRIAIIGGAVLLGLVAIAFAAAADRASDWFLGVAARWWWAPLILTPALFTGSVWLTRHVAPLARGSGIPQVIAAAQRPGGYDPGLASLGTAFTKLLLTVVALAGGASVGREGPTVQVSAALMLLVHRVLRVPISAGVFIAGGAAGVAAAFNTPLAGVAFAIEELASAYEQRVTLLVMVAIMVAGIVSLGLNGDYVYLGAMHARMSIRSMMVAAPLAGVVGGLIGGAFSKALQALLLGSNRFVLRIRARPQWTAFGAGIVVAAIGVASGGLSWGTGYGAARALVEGARAPLWFGAAKYVATLATAVSGAPGGIFAPSLAVGAGVGNALSRLFPGEPVGPIVLLGTVGYFTGVVRAPLTCVIIVVEATDSRAMLLPLFAAAVIADGVSAAVCRERLYHALSSSFLPAGSGAGDHGAEAGADDGVDEGGGRAGAV